MAKITVIANTGVLGAASSSGPTPPGNVTAISVSAVVDPISLQMTFQIGVTPPAGGTFIGCHLFAEIPDQSAKNSFVVGTTPVGGTSAVAGNWTIVDLGRQVYIASEQPWTVYAEAPPGINANLDTPCRLYAVSFSTAVENQLVRAGGGGASPNQAFSLVSKASGKPTVGTSVTQLSGPIVASVLPIDLNTGKQKTAVLVDVSTTPIIKGWIGRLVITYGNADPTKKSNQTIVGPTFTEAGPVQAPADGILLPHSFTLDTPTTVQNVTVWSQSGLVVAGVAKWNNIVPGITPSFPIQIGTTSGTIDAASVMLTSIDSSMAVVTHAFGVAVGGINDTRIAALAVTAGKLANSSVTASAIANLAVGTAAIAALAVDYTKIANATITGAQIGFATIAGANIGAATITDANIADLSASKITAGTITATISINSPTINGGSISGATLSLNANGVTTLLDNGSFSGRTYSLIGRDNSTTDYSAIWAAEIQVGRGSVSTLVDMSASATGAQVLVQHVSGGAVTLFCNGGVGTSYVSVDGHVGFTGTLAAAISGGRNVAGGIIY